MVLIYVVDWMLSGLDVALVYADLCDCCIGLTKLFAIVFL